MAGHHGTKVQWGDRDRLDEIIRPIVAEMGARVKLPHLAQKIAEVLADMGRDADEDTAAWLARVQGGALLDFLYNRAALEVGRQLPLLLVVGKSRRRDVVLKPYQGVRLAEDRQYQQISFLAMTRIEYDSWRKQEIAAINAQSKKVQVIQALDPLWERHPDAETVGELLQAAGINPAGARIQLGG